ncbi:GH25 family lysozyme [Sphingomonas sp. Leaf4]|uniref:GH25 family lysozyme n=1 Tax=Sphingomonas sp. Leaf4 TaxID=2876553 RepID=UPI001E57C499|nr:GH25 family lysozyme [Sphingomonas sp. Leaf4]
MTRARIVLIVAAVLAVATLIGWRWSLGWAPATARFAVQGVTVSAADGAIDWPMVRAQGADFAFVTASSGTARDPAFEGNWNAAHAAGLRHGALHRFSLCESTADQVTAYLTTVPRAADALPAALALDVAEDCDAHPTRAQVLSAIRGFLGPAEYHDGRPMMLRVSAAFEDEYRVSEAIVRPLWAERAFLEPAYLARPWRLWQANPARRIDGVARPVAWSVAAP